MNDEFLTVSQLNNFIRDVIASGFPRALWICGEIQGYDRGKDKKHVFFELCEKDPATHEILARTSLVIFANLRPKIDALLKQSENAFVLKDDIEVKFLCKVDFYPGHGQVRLIVENIDPVYTLGKIAQDRQRLITLLKQKGVLDKNKQLHLPRVPLHIGLITSYDSAAYHDFTDEIRKSGHGFKVFVCNAVMQGKNTESSVVAAFKRLLALDTLDLIVITRGGGSIAELSCFDSQVIAEVIAACPLPVLSGIGHEINTTVTDLAAHTFAKTPTAVAQFIVGRVEEFLLHLNERQEELLRSSVDFLERKQIHLKESALTMRTSTLELVKTHQMALIHRRTFLKQTPFVKLKQSRIHVGQQADDLKRNIHLHLQNLRTKIRSYEKLVEMADPRKVLKRGFSITKDKQGRIIRSVTDAHVSRVLVTVLVDGEVTSNVK